MNVKSYYRIALLIVISILWGCGGSNFAATQVDPAQSDVSSSSSITDLIPISSSGEDEEDDDDDDDDDDESDD